MEKDDITLEDIERLAARMAQAIPDLDCPDSCEFGFVHQYVERSALVYQEEWEWACLASILIRHGKRGSAAAS